MDRTKHTLNELLTDTLENILEYLREEYHDKTKIIK